MNTKKVDNVLNLLTYIPYDVFYKLPLISENEKINKGKIEVVVLCGKDVDKVNKSVENLGGFFENLGYGFGIITFDALKIKKINEVEGLVYVEFPKILFTSNLESSKACCVNSIRELEGLTGQGTIVGFIDTGIDYTLKAFRNFNGDTRIKYIYDLSAGGKVYSNEDINKDLKLNDPLNVLNITDSSGHGTHVAGIACAGGKIPKENYGVAYESEIIMVKTTRTGNLNFALSTQFLRGIKFLIDKAREENKPLVINISMSTNNGAHNGTSLLEQYIQTVSKLEKVSIVIAAGNEGETSHHVGGVLRDKANISMQVSEGEKSLILQLYKPLLCNLSIKITSPTGLNTGYLKIEEGLKRNNIGAERVLVYDSGPKPFDIDGETTITLLSTKEFLTSGQWNLELIKNDKYIGNFNIWMPIAEGLNQDTKFLQPSILNTLGIPATVEGVISVGSYNFKTNNLSAFSGRGDSTSYNYVKPELVAPGENILSTVPDGGFDSLSGTSMAAPHVAGICSLFLEWGLVNGNDPFLFGDRLKYYLVKGAKRDRKNISYPDNEFGYGVVCADKSFEIISSLSYQREDEYFRQDNKFLNENYITLVVEYAGNLIEGLKNKNADGFILDENYALIIAPKDEINKIIENTKEIVYVDSGGIYTLNSISPIETSGATIFNNNVYLPLDGNGVLVGIIDTGIDYLNNQFINEDDTTRVIKIWDQTIQTGKKPKDMVLGSEYDYIEINKAIEEKMNGGNPYGIVPSKDDIGHGTNVANLIGGRGENKEITGAAPNCNFVVVKLKEANKEYLDYFCANGSSVPKYTNTEVLLALKYLFNVAKEIGKPMIIYLPLGTNTGAHDGTSIIERYIDDISKARGIVVVTTTGNQGDTHTHTRGELKKNGDIGKIELRVGKNQENLRFEIWIKKPDKYALSIISPSGEVVDKIQAKLKNATKLKFVYEGTIISIEQFIPEEVTGDQRILIIAKNIREGIWNFKLIGDSVVQGKYDAWLPQRQLLDEETKFLNPNQYSTLAIPSTARRAIACSFYNQKNNSIVAQAGRGYTRDSRVKPDITVGGISAKTINPNGDIVEITGASVGGAVLAGCCALVMQWGIVDGNDSTLYSTKMITYLIRGASKREGDNYPNEQWGYGMLNMIGIFDSIRELTLKRNSNEYSEYNINSLFIRRPKY